MDRPPLGSDRGDDSAAGRVRRVIYHKAGSSTRLAAQELAYDQAPMSVSRARAGIGNEDIYDLIGVGFGPSNLALAVAAREIDPQKRCLFFERKTAVEWHPGILFDRSRLQVPFLKDLVTLRNPASPYTFLQYTKAKGRLERFVNLREFHPTRLEYQDYLQWVAEAFSADVRYGATVRRVTPVRIGTEARLSVFHLKVEHASTGEAVGYWARNVVYAGGGTPRLPLPGIRLSSKV